MYIAWEKVLPVIVSMFILIAVAVLREHSRTLAAIAATAPINVPLALWIIDASSGHDPKTMAEFSSALLVNIWPSVLFLVIAWLTARAGWSLLGILGASYGGWLLGLGVIQLLRQYSGG